MSLEKTTNSPTASLPTNQPEYGEFCRYLANIVIQIINGELKDPTQRAWYFALPSDLGEFAKTALDNKYPWAYVKKIVLLHIEQNLRFNPPITFAELHKLYPCEVVSDEETLNKICQQVIEEDPKAVADYKKGKLASLNHLKGKVMRETKGKADIGVVTKILVDKLT